MAVDLSASIDANSPTGRSVVRVTVTNTNWETYQFPPNTQRAYIVPIGGAGYWSYTATGTFSASDTDYNTIPADVSFEYPITLKNNSDAVEFINLSHSSGTGVFEIEIYSAPLE